MVHICWRNRKRRGKEAFYYEFDFLGNDLVNLEISDDFKKIYEEISSSYELSECFPRETLESIQEDIERMEEKIEEELSQIHILSDEEYRREFPGMFEDGENSSSEDFCEEIEEECEEE